MRLAVHTGGKTLLHGMHSRTNIDALSIEVLNMVEGWKRRTYKFALQPKGRDSMLGCMVAVCVAISVAMGQNGQPKDKLHTQLAVLKFAIRHQR